MKLNATVLGAMMDELSKIAGVSSPSVAVPSPGGDSKANYNASPAAPVSPAKITAKALGSTNLGKTNYAKVQTRVPTPNVSLTSEQKGLAPPVVRSS